MPLPRWLARFNLRVTNRILGPLAEHMPGMGIVLHQGRKSRRRYRTPVMVFRHGDRFVIALTYGPESQWVQNVLAQGGCEFESQGQTFQLTQPRLIHDERRSRMPAAVRLARVERRVP
jgi:deazaflavin-dependent oxidoreductase (nitroreductase family)